VPWGSNTGCCRAHAPGSARRQGPALRPHVVSLAHENASVIRCLASCACSPIVRSTCGQCRAMGTTSGSDAAHRQEHGQENDGQYYANKKEYLAPITDARGGSRVGGPIFSTLTASILQARHPGGYSSSHAQPRKETPARSPARPARSRTSRRSAGCNRRRGSAAVKTLSRRGPGRFILRLGFAPSLLKVSQLAEAAGCRLLVLARRFQ